MQTLYHITSTKEWQQAQAAGQYLPAGFATDGFIHCSFRDQVIATANRFYSGQSGLVLLLINPACLAVPVKVENLEGGTVLFPHIYGALPVTAVAAVAPLLSSAQGFVFPHPFETEREE